MQAPIRNIPGGCEVRILVQPGASRERVVGRLGDRWKLAVSAAAEKGKANEAARKLLARAAGASPAHVVLSAGPASRKKTFRIRGMTADRLKRELEAASA